MTPRFTRRRHRRYDVLLVEPRPDDAAPFIESFESTDATETVHVVETGEEALAYLNREGEHVDAPRPDLIILDLHVTGPSGEHLLEKLNERPELRSIPVLVFTTSESEEDVARSYELNANAYLEKPDSEAAFARLAQAIEDFWLDLAHLPPK